MAKREQGTRAEGTKTGRATGSVSHLSKAEQAELARMVAEDTETQPVAPDKLAQITHQAHVLQQRERDLAKAEAEVKRLNAEVLKLACEVLPPMMNEVGLKDFTLEDGYKVVLGEEVYASISKDNAPAACAWLDKNGYGAIVKSAFTIEVTKGSEAAKQREYIQKALVKAKITFTFTSAVHPQTLKVFAKESLEESRTLPETIKVHQQPRVKVVEPKK